MGGVYNKINLYCLQLLTSVYICTGMVLLYTQEVVGGLFLRPIPGHMLQTVEMTPQVGSHASFAISSGSF